MTQNSRHEQEPKTAVPNWVSEEIGFAQGARGQENIAGAVVCLGDALLAARQRLYGMPNGPAGLIEVVERLSKANQQLASENAAIRTLLGKTE